ncbi:unnamed protein product [Penicillium salamii]|nr:unnamed protein product [Penicillium salamii]CAG8395815.1 unnamed protein product [Penicillium salamii]
MLYLSHPKGSLKVAGTEISSSCVLRRLSSQPSDEAEIAESPKQSACEVVAFLPDINTGEQFSHSFDVQSLIAEDASKINNTGQYISVDGRPLSNSRGIGQEIAKIFKSYIRSAISKSEPSKQVSDPFLGLQILCPRGIYDVNIEPAKDDVMFEDRDLILALVAGLFRQHYGELQSGDKVGIKQRKDGSSKGPPISNGFDVLMARKPTSEVHPTFSHPDNSFIASIANARPSQNQSRIGIGIQPAQNSGSEPDGSVNTGAKKHRIANPDSVSRINASFQTPRRDQAPFISPSSGHQSTDGIQRSTGRQSGPEDFQCSPVTSDLPSLPISRISSRSPVRSRQPHPRALLNSSPETDRAPSFRRAERERDRERYGNGAIDTWFQRTTQASLERAAEEEAVPLQDSTELPLSSLAEQRFGSKALRDGEGESEQYDARLEASSGESPTLQFDQSTLISPDEQDDPACASMDSGRGFPVLERWAAQLHGDGAHPGPIDLEKAMDFEKRKKEANQNKRLQNKNRETIPASQQEPIPQSSQNSRYLAAKAALTSSHTSIGGPVSATKLSPNDPRAYLMRQQEISTAKETPENDTRARRLLTSRLPFEQIPDGLALYNLGVSCCVARSPEPDPLKTGSPEDEYTRTGEEAIAFSPSEVKDCLPLWNTRLEQIMKEKYESKDDLRQTCDKIDLSSAIAQHLNSFDTD